MSQKSTEGSQAAADTGEMPGSGSRAASMAQEMARDFIKKPGFAESVGAGLILFGLLLFLAVVSHFWNYYSYPPVEGNLIGIFGKISAGYLSFMLGKTAYLVGPYFIIIGSFLLYRGMIQDPISRTTSPMTIFLSISVLTYLHSDGGAMELYSVGGIVGRYAGGLLLAVFGYTGSVLIALILGAMSVLISLRLPFPVFLEFMDKMAHKTMSKNYAEAFSSMLRLLKKKKTDVHSTKEDLNSVASFEREAAIPPSQTETVSHFSEEPLPKSETVESIPRKQKKRRPWFEKMVRIEDENGEIHEEPLSSYAERMTDTEAEDTMSFDYGSATVSEDFNDTEETVQREEKPSRTFLANERPPSLDGKPFFRMNYEGVLDGERVRTSPSVSDARQYYDGRFSNDGARFHFSRQSNMSRSARNGIQNQTMTTEEEKDLLQEWDLRAPRFGRGYIPQTNPVEFETIRKSENRVSGTTMDFDDVLSFQEGSTDQVETVNVNSIDSDQTRTAPSVEDEPSTVERFSRGDMRFMVEEEETPERESIEDFEEISQEMEEADEVAADPELDADRHGQIELLKEPPRSDFTIPIFSLKGRAYHIPVEILNLPTKQPQDDIDKEIEQTRVRLETVMKEYGVGARVVAMRRGPIITLYEVKLEAGTRVSRVLGIYDEIKMNLETASLRIVAPIPGKSTIGIEAPNRNRDDVVLGEIARFDREFLSHNRELSLILGKDISGQNVYVDLSRLPHLLIAGATGAGKSVYMNALIASLLYNNSPEDVRFIMIDPKMVELKLFEGIPHLLMPVITDVKRASYALNWAVGEMERRYTILSNARARDIRSYNQRREENGRDRMPYIVVLIDELSDLMMVAAKDVEDYIIRLTQKARAVGIHIVMATQRPSVDVITALIKANCPARISFQVAQRTDSRTILDANGAETLLGRGDMLYKSPSGTQLIRYQAPLITEQEIEKIVRETRRFGEPIYIDLPDDAFDGDGGDDSNDNDELFDAAWDIVQESGKTSTSYVQRRLRIGYNRAANLIEMMEQRGYLGPQMGNKPREILKRS